VRYRFRPCLEALEDRLVLSTGVTTSAAAESAVFSTQAQTVPLSASVIDPNNSSDIVNAGTVTFAIVNGSGAAVGNSVQASVSNGTVTATNFSLPAGQAVGSYTIKVSYSDSSGNFTDAGDTSNTLAVSAASVTTTTQAASTTFNSSQAQTVLLTAVVSDTSQPTDTVNEGTVTFTVVGSNGDTIGSQSQASVSNGIAFATNFSLPAGQAVGSYTIKASYSDSSGNFIGGGNTSNTLTVGAANVTTTAQGGSTTFSSGVSTISVQANVSNISNPADTVKEGDVTFTIVDGNGNTIGSPVQATVSNGTATASYSLPASLAPGSYMLQVVYRDRAGNFTDLADTSASLTLNFTPPGSLINQVFDDVKAVLLDQEGGGTAAQSLAQGLYIVAAQQSPSQANALVQDEVALISDLTLAYDQTVMGITDPTLQARTTAQAQAVANNPLYDTPTGYALGLSVGAAMTFAFAQPDLSQQASNTALQLASNDNAQSGTTAGYQLGVSLGAILVTNFDPLNPSLQASIARLDPSLQASIAALQQAAGNNSLNSTPLLGYELGLLAGIQAANRFALL
jgi:hypothetical protein